MSLPCPYKIQSGFCLSRDKMTAKQLVRSHREYGFLFPAFAETSLHLHKQVQE